MPELRFDVEEKRGRIDLLAQWLPRLAVAIAFLSLGWDKIRPNSGWAQLFGQIGAGQWFRYFTGVVQITGALLTLVPRTAFYGIALLAATMVGATAVWLIVFKAPENAIIPAVVLIILVVVGLGARRQ